MGRVPRVSGRQTLSELSGSAAPISLLGAGREQRLRDRSAVCDPSGFIPLNCQNRQTPSARHGKL